MAHKAPFSRTRKAQRFAPTQPVTVAILDDGIPVSYGIVANISESGACFQTNVVPNHGHVSLLMSFYEGEYLQTSGRVVWSDPGDGLCTMGVEFTGLSEEARSHLRHNLGSTAFAAV
jgi:PilZ domain